MLTERPRLKVSTFHAMKGGENDNVVVHLTRQSRNKSDQDDEHRVFYVVNKSEQPYNRVAKK